MAPDGMKAFWGLLANTVVAGVTNLTVWFALTYWVFLETHSVLATSLVSGAYLVLAALSGFRFGGLVDRHPKKRLMMVSGLISLAAYLAALALFALSPREGFAQVSSPSLWIFAALLLIGVIVGNLRSIALPTVITLIVPEDRRDRANGLAGMANGTAFLIVSVISGLLVGFGGMMAALLFTVVMMAVTLAHLATVAIPERPAEAGSHPVHASDIRETFAAVSRLPGLFGLILFTTLNNFLGGVFMALMDAYGLSLVSVQAWGVIWGVLSLGFIVGGAFIAKRGLGKNPLRALFLANFAIWGISCFFTLQPSILLLGIGMFLYLSVAPFIEAAEHTVIQAVVPYERQGRVFGFAQSVESAAAPISTLGIGPLAQFVFIPFMTDGWGAQAIGPWFGTGYARGIALVFTLTGFVGLAFTALAMRSKSYRLLSARYATSPSVPSVEVPQAPESRA